MTLLSTIYDVKNRPILRGQAKSGWVRPTVKQFFTSEDWQQMSKILPRIGYEEKVASVGAVLTETTPITTTYTAWRVVQGTAGYWAPTTTSETDYTWFVLQMLEPKRIEKMEVASPPYAGGVEQLKDFKLEASTTGAFAGEETLLYSGTILEGQTDNELCEFINNNYYSYYKFTAMSHYFGNGGNNRKISLVSMYQGTYTAAPTLPSTFGTDQCYGGTVTSYPTALTGYDADNIFSGNTGSWAPDIEESITAVSWVVYEFPTVKQIQKLRIKSWYRNGIEPIAGFKLEASNTGNFTGEQTVLLVDLQEYSIVEGFQDYIFLNENQYKYYRLYIYSHHFGNGGNNREIDDVQMMESTS